ncbi:MAG: LTA synthase family protein [Eubacteriales bacterium]|nr:LTA synthase family protein [Eubacteriales bacterium]
MAFIIILLKTFIFYWQTDRLDMMSVWEVPLLTILFFVCLWFFCKGRGRVGAVLFYVIYTFFTILMLMDAAYSSYFGKYISVNQLYQLGSLSQIAGDGNVIGAAVNPLCVLTLLDLPIMFFFFHRHRNHDGKKEKDSNKNEKKIRVWKIGKRIIHLAVYVISVISFIYYGFNFTEERYVQKVNHIEFFTYHTNDLLVNVGGRIRRRNVDETDIQNRMKEVVPQSEGENYQGIAKGKNLILIQIESFNDFVIGAEYNGQTLTPNINALLKKDTFYFDRFYSTTGVGNTCDAEFATLNSLYPNEIRECYRMYVDNTYQGLPWMLREQGYSTMAFHGYVKTFWNRDEAYKNQGIQRYYSQDDFDMTEISGFGLTDKKMFRQAVDILKTKQEPFFSYMITLTNHIPYDMPQELASLTLKEEDKNTTFGRYLQTIRYTDEAIGELIEELKEAGLYDNTMIAFYGDHQGLNKETPEVQRSMTRYLGKEYGFDEMLKIPLVIHIPGMGESKTITTVGGEIDTMPTLANLMGLELPQPYVLGHDLLNTKEGFLAQISYIGKGSFIDGSSEQIFEIGKDGSVENGQVYHIPDGSSMNLNMELCMKNSVRALKLLELSREILDNNLIANYVTH